MEVLGNCYFVGEERVLVYFINFEGICDELCERFFI
jgi:hypothetical protein